MHDYGERTSNLRAINILEETVGIGERSNPSCFLFSLANCSFAVTVCSRIWMWLWFRLFLLLSRWSSLFLIINEMTMRSWHVSICTERKQEGKGIKSKEQRNDVHENKQTQRQRAEQAADKGTKWRKAVNDGPYHSLATNQCEWTSWSFEGRQRWLNWKQRAISRESNKLKRQDSDTRRGREYVGAFFWNEMQNNDWNRKF